jgi:hypothetical protein
MVGGLRLLRANILARVYLTGSRTHGSIFVPHPQASATIFGKLRSFTTLANKKLLQILLLFWFVLFYPIGAVGATQLGRSTDSKRSTAMPQGAKSHVFLFWGFFHTSVDPGFRIRPPAATFTVKTTYPRDSEWPPICTMSF